MPNIHPPAVPAHVAFAWKLAGESAVTTRVAMLLLAAVGLWATWLLGTELLPQKHGAGWFAVLALFVSPLFFMQSMLAQLDLPATVFTVLAPPEPGSLQIASPFWTVAVIASNRFQRRFRNAPAPSGSE